MRSFSLKRCADTPENCDAQCEYGQFTGMEQCPIENVLYVVIEEVNDALANELPNTRSFHWMHVCGPHALDALNRAVEGRV